MTSGIVFAGLKGAARKLVQAFGYDIRKYRPHEDPFHRLQLSLLRRKVAVLLDVGANVGQFARAIRKAGYGGHIISFEPLSDAHAKLLVASRRDPLWTIAPRCALADRCGDAEVNVAANSQSSSISNMLERHIAGAPEAVYVGKERVTTTTLDCFLDGKLDLAAKSIALKLDTQGYERAVLAGLHKWSQRVKIIMTEMSLAALYEGEPRFVELFRMIEDRGYHCISIEPGFTDPRTYEVLQVDAIFER